ncbi:hypothetical protein C8J56DRAFT_1092143 [Mycena floridula]|nr:hypothetical protein C8J56DRAFT_1092143 [Mycena floridula]
MNRKQVPTWWKHKAGSEAVDWSPARRPWPKSTDDGQDAFPAIPPEITLVVFKALVEIQPEKAMELVTLSRGFSLSFRIELHLYRDIFLASENQLALFTQLISSGSRPLTFYQDRIRNDNEFASVPDEASTFLAALLRLRPTRFSFWPEFNSVPLDLLQKVTHLHLPWPIVDQIWKNHTLLQGLPQLTHVSNLHRCSGNEVLDFASSLQLSAKIVVFILWAVESPALSWFQDHDPGIVIAFVVDPQVSRNEETAEYALFRDLRDTYEFLHDWGEKRAANPTCGNWQLEEKVELQRRLQNPS